MKNNGLIACILSFIIAFPVMAQDDSPEPSTNAPDFNSFLESQVNPDQAPIQTDQASDLKDSNAEVDTGVDGEDESIESGFIDPDFLKDEGGSYDDYPKVQLRFLNKITAESESFDLTIGKTVAYGSLRIRPMTCKKAPPIEEPESASFLQIWEKMHEGDSQWVFSGWMFASSPSLSSMEHPVYDIWVIDCKE